MLLLLYSFTFYVTRANGGKRLPSKGSLNPKGIEAIELFGQRTVTTFALI